MVVQSGRWGRRRARGLLRSGRVAEAARSILDALAAEDLHRAPHRAGGADELLVSRTARDLTAGSGLRFENRGTCELEGVPDACELYAFA